MVRIRFLYLRPAVDAIPLVVSQVDVEDGSLRVNGLWVDDDVTPHERLLTSLESALRYSRVSPVFRLHYRDG